MSTFWHCLLLTSLFVSSRSIAQVNYFEAKALLKAAYPELNGKHLQVVVQDDTSFDDAGGMTTFWIGLEHRARDQSQGNLGEAYMSAFFVFPAAKDGRIFKLVVSGSLVNQSRNENLKKVIDSHPDWPDSKLIEVLAESGAKYGPDRKGEFLRQVSLKALEAFLGKLQVLSVDFELRDEEQMRGKLPAANPQWVIRAAASKPGHRGLQYYLAFEPFEGKLILLGRTPPKF